jgi:hypothetical protein
MAGQKATEALKSVRNPTGLSSRLKRESRRIFSGGLSGHQEFLRDGMRWGRSLGNKGQLEVVDDPVHDGMVRQEGDDLHLAAALWTEEGINKVRAFS